jgi:hypothetical protein
MKCFAIRYEGVDFYNAETKEEAIKMFEKDGSHDGEELIEVEE